MVQTGAILVEAIRGNRPQAEQRAAEVVDDAAVQKAELVAGRLVGVIGNLDQHRPPEHGLVELPGSLDIGDGEANVPDRSSA